MYHKEQESVYMEELGWLDQLKNMGFLPRRKLFVSCVTQNQV